MEFYFIFSILASIACVFNEAVPLASFGRHKRSEALIIMPGVHFRDLIEEPVASNTQPVSPPLLFGDISSSGRSVPISFGEAEKVLPVKTDDKTELFPLESDNNIKDNGVPNLVLFPTGKPLLTSSPKPAAVDDEGNGDNFHFPTQIVVNLKSEDGNSTVLDGASLNEAKCNLETGSLVVNGECLTLLGRNSCPKGEWLVLSDDAQEPQCVPRPCPFGELMLNEKCVDVDNETVCNDGQMLYVDFNGHVHCDCMPNFFYDPWSGKCFAQGDQGYCNFGQRLAINETGFVYCERNPCFMDGFILNEGKCFYKTYEGYCQNLFVHLNNRTAECHDIASHTIFDLPTSRSCSSGSLRDYAGNCRRSFRVPTASSYPTIYGGCPFNFSKDSRGTCRKTQRLFG